MYDRSFQNSTYMDGVSRSLCLPAPSRQVVVVHTYVVLALHLDPTLVIPRLAGVAYEKTTSLRVKRVENLHRRLLIPDMDGYLGAIDT